MFSRWSQMRDLPERMHPGIGAARAVHADLLAADRLDRIRPAHPAPTGRCPGSASRRTARRHIRMTEFITGHRAQPAAGGCQRGAAQETLPPFIGALPARCSSRMRIAPSPQAKGEVVVEQFARLHPCHRRSRSAEIRRARPGPRSASAPGAGETATARGCGAAPRGPACSSRSAPRPCRSWPHRLTPCSLCFVSCKLAAFQRSDRAHHQIGAEPRQRVV